MNWTGLQFLHMTPLNGKYDPLRHQLTFTVCSAFKSNSGEQVYFSRLTVIECSVHSTDEISFSLFFFCAMGQKWDGDYVHLVEKRFITQSKCSILTQVFIEGVGRLCSLCQCFSREANWDGHCSGKETNAVPDNHLSSESLCHLSYRCGCNVQCFAFSCFHL